MDSFITGEEKLEAISLPFAADGRSEASFASPDKFTSFADRFRPRIALEPIDLVPSRPAPHSFAVPSPSPQYLFSVQARQQGPFEETPKEDSVRMVQDLYENPQRFYYANSPLLDASFFRAAYARSPVFPPPAFCFGNFFQADASPRPALALEPLPVAPVEHLLFRSPKITNLAGLYNLLTKLFLADVKVLEQDMQLSQLEQLLFMQLTRRKFRRVEKLLEPNRSHSQEELLQLVHKLQGEKSAKRIEERKKFVFKHTIKKLKKEFINSEFYRDNSSSKEVFYLYYFGDLAKAKQVKLENFFDPLNHRLDKSMYKTLSNNYLALIFESDHFRQDFNEYLQNEDFLHDYQRTVQKKFEKLLAKWEGLVGTFVDPMALCKTINDYFVTNRQCKLPWTPNEIGHAVASFKKFMKRPN